MCISICNCSGLLEEGVAPWEARAEEKEDVEWRKGTFGALRKGRRERREWETAREERERPGGGSLQWTGERVRGPGEREELNVPRVASTQRRVVYALFILVFTLFYS